MSVYLKTYFYSEHEYEFINANLRESIGHVDKMIICEYDVHHTGMPREFLFDMERIEPDLRDRVEYYPCEVHGKHTIEAYDDESRIHAVNEPLMRSFFCKVREFEYHDIIFSVDADEVIYRDSYEGIIELVKTNGKVRLPLYQFFYKKNYLWKDNIFRSPGVFMYGCMNPPYMNNWRDEGIDPGEIVGCHFSWCMDVDQMIKKLNSYGHVKYRFCADRKILEDAIENKKYPFDENTKFDIEELDMTDERIPESMRA